MHVMLRCYMMRMSTSANRRKLRPAIYIARETRSAGRYQPITMMAVLVLPADRPRSGPASGLRGSEVLGSGGARGEVAIQALLVR